MPLSEHVVPGLEVKMKRIRCLTALAVMSMLFGSKQGYAQSGDRELQRFREIYKELVETNTTLSAGDCTLAAKRMSARLKTAGYPDADLSVFVPDGHPKEGGLLAVLHGSDSKAKAILLLGHLDVVGAKREDSQEKMFVEFSRVTAVRYRRVAGEDHDGLPLSINTGVVIPFIIGPYDP